MLFRPCDHRADSVADDRIFDKEGIALCMAYTLSVFCKVINMDIYRIIFFHGWSVFLRLESKNRLNPSHLSAGDAFSRTSDIVSSLASRLSARFNAIASMMAYRWSLCDALAEKWVNGKYAELPADKWLGFNRFFDSNLRKTDQP